MTASDCPNAQGRQAIYLISVLASTLLLIAHHGIANDLAWIAAPWLRCLWFSEAIVVPLVAIFSIRGIAEAFPAWAALATALVIGVLAYTTGSAYQTDLQLDAATIFIPYGLCVAITLIILMPFIQLLRDGREQWCYPRLYQLTWDNILTLLTALVFSLMAWLILWLCSALFSVIGFDFFQQLFDQREFIYPVSGLFAGLGIALGRSHIGAMQAVLKVCLSLARHLLPMLLVVAVVFLVTLCFTDLQPLWDTRHATSLMLCLVLASIALVNGVYQDGTAPVALGRKAQIALSLGLLSLPIYTVIAAYALHLRVAQHGWTVERLYACVVVLVAAAYALSYAICTLRALATRSTALSGLSLPNTLLAGALALVLLLTQSALLDFRQISVSNQLQRLQDGRASAEDFDFLHLRFANGRTGYQALQDLLQSLANQPQTPANTLLATRIQAALDEKNRFSNPTHLELLSEYQAGHIRVWPPDAEVSDELLIAIQNDETWLSSNFNPMACKPDKSNCVLLALELNDTPPAEWLFLDLTQGWQRPPLFGFIDKQWKLQGFMNQQGPADLSKLTQALKQNDITIQPPLYRNLLLGKETLFQFQTP